MGDRRRRHPRVPSVGAPPAVGVPWTGERAPDWPRHPWVALVERLADERTAGRQTLERRQIAIVWWETRAGRQPVILVLRSRCH